MKPCRLLRCVLIFCSLSFVLLGASAAGGERRFGSRVFRRRPFREPLPHKRALPAKTKSHRGSVYDFYRQFYPRYYGGFHARFLYEYGLPPGDIGIRGNPW